MAWKKIDLEKYDQEKDRQLHAEMEDRRAEMEKMRVPMSQVDGNQVNVYQFKYVKAYHEAVDKYHKWFQSCLED